MTAVGAPFALGKICIKRGYKEEMLITSGWTLRDDAVRAILWLGTEKTSLLTTPDRCWWMTRVEAADYRGADVPTTIELAGQLLRRTRRLPVNVESAGDEAFGADAAILGEYDDGAGNVGVLLACTACAAAFIGASLGADDVEVWDPVA